MKVHVEIDCTPDEARAFFGLPDVKPIQEAMMAEMQRRMGDVISRTSEEVLQAWLSSIPGPAGEWQKAILGLMGKPTSNPR